MREPDYQTRDGAARLYLGDCREVLAEIEPGSVDAVVTDPPYSIQNDFGCMVRPDGLRTLSWKWDEKCRPVDVVRRVKQALAKLHDKGACFVFCGSDQVGLLVHSMRRAGLTPKMAAWVKACPPPAMPGNWWPSGFELALYGYRRGAYFGDTDPKRSNVFVHDSYRHGQPGKNGHPTQKPTELMTRIVSAVVPSDGIALDPFMGSGTTGVAALRMGRKFVGIEIEPKYFEIAKRRIEEESRRFALLEGGAK